MPGSDRRLPASVSMRIGHLALDGFALDAGQESAARRAVETELASLLGSDPFPAGLCHGGAVRRLPGSELRIGAWTDADDLGRQVARALYDGFDR